MTVEVEAEVIAVDGRKLTFKVRAHDGVDMIGEGTHDREVVAWDKFNSRVAQKAAAAGVA
jgi:fluoroacetyl-CoA thioesterase